MKTKYLIFMVFLILVAVGFGLVVVFSPLGEYSGLDKAIQSAAVFAALLAAVTALSAADPKMRTVKVKIEPSVDKADFGEYRKDELSESLKQAYQNFPDPVKSHKVQFKMTNISGFTLKNPTLTFRLPLQKQHPYRHKVSEIYSYRTFHSNLWNSQIELRLLEFADTCILSNCNLPYWDNQNDITIWFRMVLEDGKLEPFVVEVSVNCKNENANGVTKKLKIDPKDLMK